jgi:hypothetical protein
MKGVVPPLCGSKLWDRIVGGGNPRDTAGTAKVSRWTDSGSDSLGRQCGTTSSRDARRAGEQRWQRVTAVGGVSELPAWPLGRTLLAAHAPDPPLRVVSTEGNPDTTPRNKQPHTNDEEPERPGQQRRSGLARRVVSLPPPSAEKAQSRKEGLACPESSQWQLPRSGRSD